LLETVADLGIGCIVFSPLAQGLLTNRYLGELPADSRAVKSGVFLSPDDITQEKLAIVRQLDTIAAGRGQSLAQMSVAWVLRHEQVTSALIGASRVSQIEDILATLQHLAFNPAELLAIDAILSGR
jgi:L-glyceraldehyde 3-phosphate reductase